MAMTLQSWEILVSREGRLLPKPKARIDAYRVNSTIFNFAASNIDALLKVRNVREAKFVSVPLNTVQWFEKDARVVTMVGSFLDCSDATSTRLLKEVSCDESASEGTQQMVGILLVSCIAFGWN